MNNDNIKDSEISEKAIVHFEEGLPGFDDCRNFVIMQEDDSPYIMILQSLETEHASLFVLDPFAIAKDYSPVLSEQDTDYFGDDAKLKYLCVTVISDDVRNTVVNLKSPIVIDTTSNRAKQVFVENKDYPVRYHLFGSDI